MGKRRGWLIGGILAAVALVAGTVAFVVSRRGPDLPEIEAEPVIPASRSALTWPFAWDSIWNLPLGVDAKLVAAGLDLAGSSVSVDEDILILEPDAPKVDVIANEAGWDPARSRCGEAQTAASNGGASVLLAGVPVPESFSTDPGFLGDTPNASAALLTDDGRTVAQTQPFHRCGAGGVATSQYTFPTDDIVDGDGIQGAHGGSMMSSLGGTIRVGELVPGGAIHHALKIELDCSRWCYAAPNEADGSAGHRWPAVVADSYAKDRYGGTNPALQMGTLLALPADFDLHRIGSEPARIIARALRDHGAYVVDDAAYPTVAFTTEWGPRGRVVEEFTSTWGFAMNPPATIGCDVKDANCQWVNDIGLLMASLQVVDDNTETSVGGAGARRSACAPPFSDGTGGAPASCSPPVANGTRQP